MSVHRRQFFIRQHKQGQPHHVHIEVYIDNCKNHPQIWDIVDFFLLPGDCQIFAQGPYNELMN